MKLFAIIDAECHAAIAAKTRFGRPHITKIRNGTGSMSLKALARFAGCFDHLDLRGTLAELEPEEYEFGRRLAHDRPELPHRQQPVCEEVA